MTILTGGGSAWRALYLHRGTSASIGDQLARIVIDPHGGVHPELSIGIGRRSLRVPLPAVPWKYEAGTIRAAAYRLSQWFWHGMDGRYGWRGSAKVR